MSLVQGPVGCTGRSNLQVSRRIGLYPRVRVDVAMLRAERSVFGRWHQTPRSPGSSTSWPQPGRRRSSRSARREPKCGRGSGSWPVKTAAGRRHVAGWRGRRPSGSQRRYARRLRRRLWPGRARSSSAPGLAPERLALPSRLPPPVRLPYAGPLPLPLHGQRVPGAQWSRCTA